MTTRDMQAQMSAFLTKASEVSPSESHGLFWCHGRGLDPDYPKEPPFETMIDVPTLLNLMASDPRFIAGLMELSGEMA